MTAIWNGTEIVSIISTIAGVLLIQAIAGRIPTNAHFIKQQSKTNRAQTALTQPEVKDISDISTLSEDYLRVHLAEMEVQQRHLIGNISHELRTPLTLIYGYMQSVLRRGSNLTEIQREALEIAITEMQQTIELLQELLDLARANKGMIRFQIEPVSLHTLTYEVIKIVEKSEHRAIVIDMESMPVTVQADPHYLKQVLIKLLDNAVRYSAPQTPITVKLHHAGDWVSICISDRGHGISEADQMHIFEPLYRVDHSRDRGSGGVGLGLASVKMLIEGMGGSISVESEIGAGSTFSIALPS